MQQPQQQVLQSMAANDETLGHENDHGYQTFGNQQQPGSNQTGSNIQQNSSNSSPLVSEQPTSTDHARSSNNPRPSIARVRSVYTPYLEDKLRRKLKFFFMGPHEKVKAKGKCPWKLLIQVFKIIIVTVQVILDFFWLLYSFWLIFI